MMISFNGGSNWMIWKPRMEDSLFCKNLVAPLEGDISKPAEMRNEDWKKVDHKAVDYIRQWLDDSVFHHGRS